MDNCWAPSAAVPWSAGASGAVGDWRLSRCPPRLRLLKHLVTGQVPALSRAPTLRLLHRSAHTLLADVGHVYATYDAR